MATDKRIKVGVDLITNVDNSSLEKFKRDLSQISRMSLAEFASLNPQLNLKDAEKQFSELRRGANKVKEALNDAFNVKIGTTNLTEFKQKLEAINLKGFVDTLNSVGPKGSNAFRALAKDITSVNLQFKENNRLLDKMAESFANTVRWGITSSVFNKMSNSIQSAWNFSIKLNSSLNDIRVVTNKSAEEMTKFAVQANKAAQALGASTRDYTEASLIYYQQGLTDAEVRERTNVTLKAANVTGQSAQQVSEQLTAV